MKLKSLKLANSVRVDKTEAMFLTDAIFDMVLLPNNLIKITAKGSNEVTFTSAYNMIWCCPIIEEQNGKEDSKADEQAQSDVGVKRNSKKAKQQG